MTTRELADAETALLKLAQEEHFLIEISDLKNNTSVPKKRKLLSLNPFLDENQALRVGGRLIHVQIDYYQRHPVFVPARHPIAVLLINYEPSRLLHAGPQHTLSSLRNRYWILSAKNVVRKVLHQCIRCFRVKPTGFNPVMGKLPVPRVNPARPFSTCGMDYAGPLLLKERQRSRVTYTSYICAFVCFATKTVHIELATDLSTDAFLNYLYRFIAREGRIHCIYSDNGTNFAGAKKQLNDLRNFLNSRAHNEQVEAKLVHELMQWYLIPPHSPHFEGLWESAVKLIKYHLKRVMGEQRMTFEELYTVLAQIEACLNSHPLHPLSSDPNDLNPLTPGQLLIANAFIASPQQDLLDVK